jgi:thiol-disulfide isomerase/thioredoxin
MLCLLPLLATIPSNLAQGWDLVPPTSGSTMAPNLVTLQGKVHLTWLEGGEKAYTRLRMSSYDAWSGWTAPVTIATDAEMMANWADFPALAASTDGTLFAHWLRRVKGGRHAYEVQLARSTNGGASWTSMGTPHKDGTPTEHGFVSMVPAKDPAQVRLFWLDGRETPTKTGAMTLRTTTAGTSIAPDTRLDGRVCDCCGTAAIVTPRGPRIIYRDRDADEIRDLSMMGPADKSSTPIGSDNWKIAGCPVNGPAADANATSAAVTWFTGAQGKAHVRVAFSSDGGVTFQKAIDVHPEAHDKAPPLGRVDLVLDGDKGAWVSWIAAHGTDAVLNVRHVGATGHLGPIVKISDISPSRSSGFPRMALAPDKRLGRILYFAWTDAEKKSLAARALPADSVPPGNVAAAQAPAPAPEKPQATAPFFKGLRLDGSPVTSASLRGKPALVQLWATWCAPCMKEIPELKKLHKELGQRLQVLAINMDSAAAADSVKQVIESRAIDYPVWLDPANEAATAFGVPAIPASHLLDAEGRVVWKHLGLLSAADPGLREAIKALTDGT